jgi:hypothetical protein
MFEEFCRALPLSGTQRSSIASRTATITRRLNSDFRATASDTANRFYAGSYGRNTALASVSDIDLMYVLPYSTYVQYNAYANNKQSALLQAVRASLNMTYPNSAVVADGQIVQIGFTDNITYEIVPVFVNTDESYTFPDSNNGGSWRTCKPKHEINEFATRDANCNRNLVELGRMARAWRDNNSVKMTGMLIDRSGPVCLNSFPRFISGLRAGCRRCRVVHGGGRRLRRTDRRGGQLGAHHGTHLMRPSPRSAAWRSNGRRA